MWPSKTGHGIRYKVEFFLCFIWWQYTVMLVRTVLQNPGYQQMG
jgi:hypothetical protein